MKSFDQLARAAYEAHAKAQLNRAGRGGNIYPWECLKPAERTCWVETAMAVAAEISTVL